MADVSINNNINEDSLQLNLSVEGEVFTPSSPGNSPTKHFVKLKDDDFVEAAGLTRTGNSARKSSMERLLEQSLNTLEVSPSTSPTPRSPTASLNRSLQHVTQSSDSESDDAPRRRRGAPSHRPQKLQDDKFIADAGLARTGMVGRKSSRERLLEEQLNTKETIDAPTPAPTPTSTTPRTFTPRQKSESNQTFKRSDSNSSESGRRKSSVYEQKEIEAPKAMVGNRIANRTKNLFKQYEKDMTSHEAKPLNVAEECEGEKVGIRERKQSYSKASSERTKVDAVRQKKEEELIEIRQQYRQRLLEEEREEAERRRKQRENAELKYSKKLGDAKNLYLSAAEGAPPPRNDDSQNIIEEEEELLDKHGNKVERHGGKVAVVPSPESVTNIRYRLGSIGKAGWKKQQASIDKDSVDSNKIKSARNLFKEIEVKKDNTYTFNRPKSRKIRDPKELMEMRKKITYGENGQLPQDGVINKTVVIDSNEVGNKKNALNLYKTLESRNDTYLPTEKPTNRLLSDEEVRVNMNKKMSTSTTASEGSEDLTIDVNADVSGYGSACTPCSPSSTVSDDYTCLSEDATSAHDEKTLTEDPSVTQKITDISLSEDTLNITFDNNANIENDADKPPFEKTPYEGVEQYAHVEYL